MEIYTRCHVVWRRVLIKKRKVNSGGMKVLEDGFLLTVLEEGDKLFHYTSADGLQGIVGGEFWITESHFLNDITEFQVATEVFCEVLNCKLKNAEIRERIKKAVCEENNRLSAYGQIGEEVAYFGDYVISFCLERDSILLWSEYSDFCGYCIEFDFDKLLSSFPKPNEIMHGKVIYSHEDQLSLMIRTIENEFFKNSVGYDYLTSWEDMDKLTDKQIKEIVPHMGVVVSGYNMFFKKECFAGENEYRFIFTCCHDGGRYKDEEREKQYFRVKNGVLIPFVKQPLSSLESVRSILIGPKNNSDIAVKGVEYFLRNHKIRVPVEKSKMPLRY